MNATEYASELIRFDSTWYRPNAPICDWIERALQRLGCETERIEYQDEQGVPKVNVLGRKGQGRGGLAYFGHTDVVVSDDWALSEHGPFEPVVRDGRLYGRGSTDMKGSVACALAALESLKDEHFAQPFYISCSADEEISHQGAIEIAERSRLYRQLVEGCASGIVGEPTRLVPVYAHKGGCRITVTARGRAAHSSTREGLNANWAMIPFLADMKQLRDETESQAEWHDGEFDPPTICLNLGINDFIKAVNITAPQSVCTLGFRPMPSTDDQQLIDRIRRSAEQAGLEFHLHNHHPAFRRAPDSAFLQLCTRLITTKLAGSAEPATVAYGSEASNFTQVEQLVVLGPGDIRQAHTHDEWISLEQLEQGENLYRQLIRACCLGA